ncbi:MAG: hypothetical protein JNK48_19630 [Bryobacterales bacterium]|nr:hypothetical protein [Bryobacterales bacterium]
MQRRDAERKESVKRRRVVTAGLGAWMLSGNASEAPGAAAEVLEPLDYGRSFLQGKWAENRVRFWVESRTRIIDGQGSGPVDYYQCASCKSENTFASKDLFHKDNYDFLPIFGPEDGVIFRRKAWLNSDYRQVRKASEMWEGQEYKLVRPKAARLLRTNREIREATHAGAPIVAQTEISDAETGLRAILEFPVKTMNIHDKRDMYQVDSGPVGFPDLRRRYRRRGESLSLAFVAFNSGGSADFVIEAPTPITENGREVSRVYHYSRLESRATVNRLYACE